MTVQVLIPELFISQKSLKMISDDNREMTEIFPKQLPFGTSEESINLYGKVTKATMNTVMLINIGGQLVFKFLLDRLIGLMLELQQIGYLQYLAVVYPANALIY